MNDDFAKALVRVGEDPRLKTIIEDVCAVTGMGFAAIACVTRDRWVACQVEDRIELGLDPGSELDVKTTICDDVREYGDAVVIDDVVADTRWSRHPTPVLYGFKSYASFPIVLDDGVFFGTLCALDPQARTISADDTIAFLEDAARRVKNILSEVLARPDGEVICRTVTAESRHINPA